MIGGESVGGEGYQLIRFRLDEAQVVFLMKMLRI